jgi:hypothetical protein
VREVFVAAALFGLLVLAALATHAAQFGGLLYYAGGFLVAGGLVFSVPCALVYHLRLYRSLAPRKALDERWIWNPTGHHARLTREERPLVLPWFYAGAAGWGATVLGCVLIGLATLGG